MPNCTVVDLEDSPPRLVKQQQAPPPTVEDLRQAIVKLLKGRDFKDLALLSLKSLRQDLETRFSLREGFLNDRRNEIKIVAQQLVQAAAVADIQDSPPRLASQQQVLPPTPQHLRRAIVKLLEGRDFKALALLSLKSLRQDLETQFCLGDGALNHRRDEIKIIAQQLVQEAAKAGAASLSAVKRAAPLGPAAPYAAVEPVAKKRKGAQRTAPTGIEAQDPLPPPPPPPSQASLSELPQREGPKIKRAPSAFQLFCNEVRPGVVEEHAQSNGNTHAESNWKSSFGDIMKACSLKWKDLSEEARRPWIEKAEVAKTEAEVASSQQQQSLPKGKASFKGVAKKVAKAGNTIACSRRSQAEFLQLAQVVQGSISNEDIAADGGEPVSFTMPARCFSTGKSGWFFGSRMRWQTGGKTFGIMLQVTMTICGSKQWESGEEPSYTILGGGSAVPGTQKAIESEAGAGAGSLPRVEAEAGGTAQAEPEAEKGAEAGSEAKAGAEEGRGGEAGGPAQAEAETGAEAIVEAKTEAKAEAGAKEGGGEGIIGEAAEAEAAEREAQVETGAESQPQAEEGAEAKADAKAEVESEEIDVVCRDPVTATREEADNTQVVPDIRVLSDKPESGLEEDGVDISCAMATGGA